MHFGQFNPFRGTTGGCSATGILAPTCAGTPGDENRPARHGRGQQQIAPRPRPGRDTGRYRRRQARPSTLGTAPTAHLLARQRNRCPLLRRLAHRLPKSPRPTPPEGWENWWLGVTHAGPLEHAASASGQQPGTPQDTTTSPDTRLLPPGADRPGKAQEPGTATRAAPAACLSRMPGNWHVRF